MHQKQSNMRTTILIGLLINIAALIVYFYFDKTINVVFHSLFILIFLILDLKDDINKENKFYREFMTRTRQKQYSKEEVKRLLNDFADAHDISLTDSRTQDWIRENFPGE